jgi:hypothetical protein
VAKIITVGKVREWGCVAWPKCSGCGEEFQYTPGMLDSRIRGHWSSPFQSVRIEAGKAGSKGSEIAEWAKKHEACPDPVEEVLPSGITFIDRRRAREP